MNRDVEGNPQIELTLGVLEQDAPSLVPSLFGDIDIAHDFDATGEHRYQIGGKILVKLKHPVLPEAHAESILGRFYVNVARPFLDRGHDERIDDTGCRILTDFGHDVEVLHPLHPPDRFLDGTLEGDGRCGVGAENLFSRFHIEAVQRIGKSHHHFTVFIGADGNQLV